jgi:hypothetical protein
VAVARPSGDERAGQIQTDLLLSCDALLMGRCTYDGFAPIWPTRSGDPFSDHIKRDAQGRRLHDAQGPGVDQHPRHRRRRLFGPVPAAGFHLADVTTLSDGIVILSYQTDERLPRGGADA